MRVLVLGAEGMLGHKMLQVIGAQFQGTLGTVRGELTTAPLSNVPLFSPEHTLSHMEVMNYETFADRVREVQPDVLVNCIGIIKQRPEVAQPLQSIFVNALLPHRLAALAKEWGGRVIHFSTDCVFDGRKGGYREGDRSTAEDLYGRTKFLGEVVVANALCLRTSFIGRELSNFTSLLEWFLAQRGKVIQGYKRVIYAGVTTSYLAELVCRILREHPQLSGLYHVTAPPISKHDLLWRVRDAFGLDVTIEPEHATVSDRSMSGARFRDATGFEIPSWDSLIRQLAADQTPYETWRSNARQGH